LLKGSPYELNSEHKAVARAPSHKENEKPARKTEEKINIFSQDSTATKPDYLQKIESRKRGPMSSATTTSTVAQSQSTLMTNSTANQSVTSRVSRKRGKAECASAVKIGVKRKSPITLEALELGTQLATHGVEDFSLKVKSTGELRKFNLLSEEKFMKGLDNDARVSQFDMNKLEIEYDYDTESE